jgi:hypothetical protein
MLLLSNGITMRRGAVKINRSDPGGAEHELAGSSWSFWKNSVYELFLTCHERVQLEDLMFPSLDPFGSQACAVRRPSISSASNPSS